MQYKISPEEQLTSFGLTSTEARLYIAGLKLAKSTPQKLSKETGIKRPTVYHALGTLSDKGLVSEQKEGQKTFYTMANPTQIHGLVELKRVALDEQAKYLEELIPLLLLQQQDTNKPIEVVHYHGNVGMKMAMDTAFRCKAKHWDIIAPYQNFLRESDPEYIKYYLNARRIRQITSRALWEKVPMNQSRPLSDKERTERNPRLLPPALQGKFKSMVILFDDKIAIFSSKKEGTAILITSVELHDMFTAIFNSLWESAEEYVS